MIRVGDEPIHRCGSCGGWVYASCSICDAQEAVA